MGINLNRNGWHRKLQNYVIGRSMSSSEDIVNLCPYFWLTIFCLFVVPFVFVAKTINKAWDGFFKALEKSFIGTWLQQFDEWLLAREEAWFEKMDAAMLVGLYDKRHSSSSIYKKCERMEVSKTMLKRARDAGYNDVWSYLRNVMEEERKRIRDLKAVKSAEKRSKQAKRERIMMKVGKAFSLIFSILGLFVLYFLFDFFVWLWNNYRVDWELVGKVLLCLGSFVIGAIFAVGVLALLSKVAPVLQPVGFSIKKGLKKIFLAPLVKTCEGIAAVIVFIWTYLKNTKEGYCPSISWED